MPNSYNIHSIVEVYKAINMVLVNACKDAKMHGMRSQFDNARHKFFLNLYQYLANLKTDYQQLTHIGDGLAMQIDYEKKLLLITDFAHGNSITDYDNQGVWNFIVDQTYYKFVEQKLLGILTTEGPSEESIQEIERITREYIVKDIDRTEEIVAHELQRFREFEARDSPKIQVKAQKMLDSFELFNVMQGPIIQLINTELSSINYDSIDVVHHHASSKYNSNQLLLS